VARSEATALAGLVDIPLTSRPPARASGSSFSGLVKPAVGDVEWKIPRCVEQLERNRARSYFQATAAASTSTSPRRVGELRKGS